MTAQFFISCAGMLSAPIMSNFPGEKSFKGQIFHTARWPKKPVDLAGKRVGVIGTGATGIQVIQTIASEVEKLTVFQRTPQYTIPINNPKLTDGDRNAFKARFHELRERVLETFVKEKRDEWVAHHDEVANSTLLAKTHSWYMGALKTVIPVLILNKRQIKTIY